MPHENMSANQRGFTIKILFTLSFACLIGLASCTAYLSADEADETEPAEHSKAEETRLLAFLDVIKSGDVQAIAQHIAQHPEDIHREESSYGVTPLSVAVSHDYIEVVKLLLKHGADASQAASGGSSANYSTPMTIAMFPTYSKEEVEQLGWEMAEVERRSAEGFAIFKLLFHSAGDGCVESSHAFLVSIVNPGYEKYTEYMLENGGCIGQTSDMGVSIFAEAIDVDIELAKKLIPKVGLNYPDGWGNYALHYAVQSGSKSLVERLLQYDIYPSPTNADGKTPLDLAPDPYDHECYEWQGFGASKPDCSEEQKRAADDQRDIHDMLNHACLLASKQRCRGYEVP